MKTQLLDYWLYLYLGCIYLVPLFAILKLNNGDTRFMLRKLLFPLEYLIQVKAEQAFSNSRSATRLIHILLWCVSILGLVGAKYTPSGFKRAYDEAYGAFSVYHLLLYACTNHFLVSTTRKHQHQDKIVSL